MARGHDLSRVIGAPRCGRSQPLDDPVRTIHEVCLRVSAARDHVGQLAREHQARIVNEDASAYPADYPQLLSGDMNCAAGNPAIDTFLKGGWQDTYTQAHGPDDPGATFHSFQGPDFKSDLGKIDWIFSRGAVRTTSAEIIRDNNQGRYPSDHYFVTTEVELLV